MLAVSYLTFMNIVDPDELFCSKKKIEPKKIVNNSFCFYPTLYPLKYRLKYGKFSIKYLESTTSRKQCPTIQMFPKRQKIYTPFFLSIFTMSIFMINMNLYICWYIYIYIYIHIYIYMPYVYLLVYIIK